MTEENISAVEALIKEDPRRTYKDTEGALGTSSPSVSTILLQQLRVRKISSRWLPHHLPDGLQCTRVEWCTEMLKRFNNRDSHRVSDIVTGDETWIYQFDPETKRQSSSGSFQMSNPQQKSRGKGMLKKNGGHFLLNEWSSGNCCARGSEDSYSEMVYTSLSPPSIPKNSGEAAKDRTARNSAPP